MRELRIGVNWTRGVHLPLVKGMIDGKVADFVEILIDNFLQVPPREMAEALDGVTVAFHIMHSRFLERSDDELDFIAARVRALAHELRPIYVSDHLLRFSLEGRATPYLPELDYARSYEHVRRKVGEWQNRLESVVLFENYPSVLDSGLEQPAFLESLLQDTGAGLLFDVSNAVCAHRNCGLSFSRWDALLEGTRHFHVAGYEFSTEEPFIALDLHGSALADDTLAFAEHVLRGVHAPSTISVERDNRVELEPWSSDLNAIRRIWEHTEGAARGAQDDRILPNLRKGDHE